MIKVTIKSKFGFINQVIIKGHSKMKRKGQDILCASVSTLYEYLKDLNQRIPMFTITHNKQNDEHTIEIIEDVCDTDYSKLFHRDSTLISVVSIIDKLCFTYPDHIMKEVTSDDNI